MTNFIPQEYYKNEIAKELEKAKEQSRKLSYKGYIFGLLAVDQNAKLIAINETYDRQRDPFQLSLIGSQLFNIGREGRGYFDTQEFEQAFIQYKDKQIVVKNIGSVNLNEGEIREIIIVLLADKQINLGVLFLQINSLAGKIREFVQNSEARLKTLMLDETEYKEFFNEIKKRRTFAKVS